MGPDPTPGPYGVGGTSQGRSLEKLVSFGMGSFGVGGAPQQQQDRALWLDAWSDPVAGISAYTPCIHTCNLSGDGEWRLVVADDDRKLKVCVGGEGGGQM